MRLIIRLLVAALIANAVWHVGSAYVSYYRFKDAVKDTTLFQTTKSDDQLKQRILELASQFDVPLTDDDFVVRREHGHIYVDGSYRRVVEVVPGFKRPWGFEVHIDTLTFEGIQQPLSK